VTITCCRSVHLATLALGLTMTVALAAAQSTHVLVPANNVQWGPAPPQLPAGAQVSVLEGNPAEKGAVTLRLRFPANYNIPPHWHSMTERVTVLSGALHVGMGDTLNARPARRSSPAASCRSRQRCITSPGLRLRPLFRSVWKGPSISSTSIRPTTRRSGRPSEKRARSPYGTIVAVIVTTEVPSVTAFVTH
jgi:hypothetical protein